MVADVSEGDEIVLQSGIHGFVNSVDADVIWLEVSKDTELKVSKAAIQGLVTSDS